MGNTEAPGSLGITLCVWVEDKTHSSDSTPPEDTGVFFQALREGDFKQVSRFLIAVILK